ACATPNSLPGATSSSSELEQPRGGNGTRGTDAGASAGVMRVTCRRHACRKHACRRHACRRHACRRHACRRHGGANTWGATHGRYMADTDTWPIHGGGVPITDPRALCAPRRLPPWRPIAPATFLRTRPLILLAAPGGGVLGCEQ